MLSVPYSNGASDTRKRFNLWSHPYLWKGTGCIWEISETEITAKCTTPVNYGALYIRNLVPLFYIENIPYVHVVRDSQDCFHQF